MNLAKLFVLTLVVVATVCVSAQAVAAERRIVDGWGIDQNGRTVAIPWGLSAETRIQQWPVPAPIFVRPAPYPAYHPISPPSVYVYPPVYIAPIYVQPAAPVLVGPTYYWHEGYHYRSELTGYQWRWRNGHWCTISGRH